MALWLCSSLERWKLKWSKVALSSLYPTIWFLKSGLWSSISISLYAVDIDLNICYYLLVAHRIDWFKTVYQEKDLFAHEKHLCFPGLDFLTHDLGYFLGKAGFFCVIPQTVDNVSPRKLPRVWGTFDFGKKPWSMCLGRWEWWRWWRLGLGSVWYTIMVRTARKWYVESSSTRCTLSCSVAELLQLHGFCWPI